MNAPSLLIHSPVEGHSGWMAFAFTNKTAINILVKFLCEPKFSFLLGKSQEVGLLGHKVNV